MKEKNPIEELVEQVSNLLEMIHQAEAESKKLSADKLSPDLLQKIDRLEKDVETFNQMNNSILEQITIDKTGSNLSPREKQLLERIKKMKLAAMELQMRYDFVVISEKTKVEGNPLFSQEKKEEKGKKKGTGLKKKLKGIGSKKNWNRL